MARPKRTDPHMRIAHAISEEVLSRQFTSRQRRILDLILRLSWGCNKEYAYIPLLRDFEICGVYKNDISKELLVLEAEKVIFWAREDHQFAFNKDFDQWQVSRGRTTVFRNDRFQELLAVNVNSRCPAVSKILTDSLNKVSKLLTDGVSKTLTDELVNYQPKNNEQLVKYEPKVSKTLTDSATNPASLKKKKESIKDNISPKVDILSCQLTEINDINSETEKHKTPENNNALKGPKPMQPEAGEFLQLIQNHEGVKLIDTSKLIGSVRRLLVRTNAAVVDIFDCYKRVRQDQFWSTQPPPTVIMKLSDYVPSYLKLKEEGRLHEFCKRNGNFRGNTGADERKYRGREPEFYERARQRYESGGP